MPQKKTRDQRKLYAHYQYQKCDERTPQPEQWWSENQQYLLAATLKANSVEEAHALTCNSTEAWYRKPGVRLHVHAPVRESRDGDVFVLLAEGQDTRGQQIWMLLGSPVPIDPPVEDPVHVTRQQKAVHGVAWSPDGASFAVGGKQGLVRIHLLGSQRDAYYDTHAAYVQSLAWSPDGKRIATGDDRDATHIFDVTYADSHIVPAGRILICREPARAADFQGTYALVWSPDGALVAAGSDDGHLSLWHVQTGACLMRLKAHQQAIRALAWSPHGSYIASVGDDQAVHIWDRDEQRLVHTHTVTFLGPLRALAWTPDGRTLLVGGREQPLLVAYEALGERKGEILLSRSGLHLGIESVTVAPRGDYAAVGCTDGTVQIVQPAAAGKHLHTYYGHRGPVTAVAWSPSGQHILSGGEDTAALVWNVPPLRVLGRQAPHVPPAKGEPPASSVVEGEPL